MRGMRILLKVPPTWYVEPHRSGLTHYRIPEVPCLRMLVSALAPLPTDVASWRARELHALVPEDCELVVTDERRAFSDLGWPLRIIDAECRRGATPVEQWLAVFLQNGGSGGVALVRAPRADLTAARRRELLGILGSARADASGIVNERWGGLAGKARA